MRNEGLMLDVGLANELKMAFRRAGYTEAEIKEISKGDFLAGALQVLRGQASIVDSEGVLKIGDFDILAPALVGEFDIKKEKGIISCFNTDFKEQFSQQVVGQREGYRVSFDRLRRDVQSSDFFKPEIRLVDIDLSAVFYFAKSGLLSKLHNYVFCVLSVNKVFYIIDMHWYNDGWFLSAYNTSKSRRWCAGCVVLSRIM
ncbi:MAG: hypothetical protein WCO84_05020 [bacterium]